MPKKHSKKHPARDHIGFLVSSLSNPKEPQHCGACLYAALVLATPCSKNSSTQPIVVPTSLLKKVEFWNALYAFIFQPRSDEELESLLQRLARCSCPLAVRLFQSKAVKMDAKEDHVHRNSTMAFALEHRKALYTHERIAFLTMAFIILAAGLRGSGVRSVAKGTSQTWPTTPFDLIPFGADSLVQTLLQWYRFIPDPIVFGLTGRIIHVCQFLLIPSLAKYQFSRPAILRGKEEIGILECHGSQDPRRNRLISLRINWYITNFLDYFQVIFEELPASTRARTLAGYETKAMQLFSWFVYISIQPNSQSTISEFTSICADYCGRLFRFFHMHLYPHPNYPVHPNVAQIDNLEYPPPASLRTVPSGVASALICHHQETQCCAYGCPGSIQSAGNNFQRCSRCQIVSYCSRECQIRAWRDEKFPHKKICPIFRLLIDTAGGLDIFVSNTSESGGTTIKLSAGPHSRRPAINQSWETAGVDRDLIQYVHDWSRWFVNQPDRIMPDGSWWNPGFEDYDEIVQRMGGPCQFMDRLARWPCEEAWVKATLELMPFFEPEVDRYDEPLPQSWKGDVFM